MKRIPSSAGCHAQVRRECVVEAKRLRAEVKHLRAKVKHLRAALADFRDHGVRCDLNPTERFSFSRADRAGYDSYVRGRNEGAAFYQEYLVRVDKSVRARAAVALGEKSIIQAVREIA